MRLILSIIFLSQTCKALCNNFFPKTLGGLVSSTYLLDIDASNDTIFTCGYTKDSALKGFHTSNADWFPIIAAFDILSVNSPKWA